MKAILKPGPDPGLILGEAPTPGIRSRDVLIRVRRAGICGTDLHIHQWDRWSQNRVNPPLILGHEFMGEVVETGRLVENIEVGDRVSAEGHLVCGHCEFCGTGQAHVCRDTRIIGIDRDGAFAEYVSIPAANIIHIPESISDDHAAVFDPLGNAFHTVLHTDVAGRVVAVVGCGPIGLFAIGIARVAGAARVIAVEPHEGRRELAARMGAHDCLDPTEGGVETQVAELTRGYGAHVVCEMSGHPEGVRSAFRMCRNGGHVRLLGLPKHTVEVNLARDIIFKGLHVYGVAGRLMYRTWIEMRDFLAAGRLDIDPVITHRLPFDRFEEGIAAMNSGEAAKVVLALD
ncbi:L-threonine 3-dehydrogenase [Candidatus Palauibacter sp.]|uniref:L-threonine 3-dehydrogenase n=1 Tax=Candidatus Palauibacter sp. TaxID=3101350 RepID=UPI003C7019B1